MPNTLYCRCAYAQVIAEADKNRHLEALCASGQPFEAVPDLCEMAARRDPFLRAFADAAADQPLTIVACHPRAVHGLFHQAAAPLPPHTTIVNMREPQTNPTVQA